MNKFIGPTLSKNCNIALFLKKEHCRYTPSQKHIFLNECVFVGFFLVAFLKLPSPIKGVYTKSRQPLLTL